MLLITQLHILFSASDGDIVNLNQYHVSDFSSLIETLPCKRLLKDLGMVLKRACATSAKI